MEVTIKKKKGIDNLVSGYSPSKVEEEIVLESSSFREEHEELFLNYHTDLETRHSPHYCRRHSPFNHIKDVLLPEEINIFLLSTVPYEKYDSYSRTTGWMVSKLIQNSFDVGYDDFSLRAGFFQLDFLASYLRGRKEKPVQVEIFGNCGQDVAYGMRWVDLVIHGNVYNNSFRSVLDSTITLHGMAEGWGIAQLGAGTTFKTSNSKALDVLLKNVPLIKPVVFPGKKINVIGNKVASGHRIIFIHSSGEEEVIADYSEQGVR